MCVLVFRKSRICTRLNQSLPKMKQIVCISPPLLFVFVYSACMSKLAKHMYACIDMYVCMYVCMYVTELICMYVYITRMFK
jgi:hypothetical protein